MIVATVLLLPYAASARAPRCTKPDSLFEATCDISEKVARVWGTLAPDNTQSCRFQIWVDANGSIGCCVARRRSKFRAIRSCSSSSRERASV
jgi:hypothetical protein